MTTPDDLRAAAAAALSGGRWDANLATFLPEPAGRYAARFLPGGRLVLDGATVTPTAGGATVAGTGATAPLLGMDVAVSLTADGDVARAVLDATGDDQWSFAANVPALRGSFLEGQRFEQPRLRLDSAVVAQAEAASPGTGAATFTGTLIVGTRLAILDIIFGRSPHGLTGEIRMLSGLPGSDVPTSTVPYLVLDGPVGGTVDLVLFRLEQLRYEIYGTPYFDYFRRDLAVATFLRITGIIPVTTSSGSHEVLVYTDIAADASTIRLTADFRDVGPLALADVARLVGVDDLGVPGGPDLVSPVILADMTLTLLPAAGPAGWIGSLSVLVQADDDWDLVPGLITLQALDITFRIFQPLSPTRSVSAQVWGLLGIGASGTLELGGYTDTRTFSGGLRKGDPPLHIREVYEHFLHQAGEHLPDITVNTFRFSVALPDNNQQLAYSGEILLDANWTIAEHLELHDVTFTLDHRDDATSFTAAAQFDTGWATVDVAVNYDSAPGKGWSFTGATGAGEKIPIGAIVEHFAEQFTGLALPAPVAGLTVENLAVRFTAGDRVLFLTAETRLPVGDAELDLTVTIDTGRRLFTGVLTVTVDGTVLEFDVRFAEDPAAARFVAAFRHTAGSVPTVKQLVTALNPAAAVYVPDGITIDLRDALFAFDRTELSTVYVATADLRVVVDLAGLPLVGERLAGGGAVGVDPLRLIVLSAALPAAEAVALNALLPAGVAPLPAGDRAAGLSVDAVLQLGGISQVLSLPDPTPATPTPAPAPAPIPAPGQPPATDDNVVWYKVQRSFGPLTLDRIGFAYQRPPGRDAELAFLLDASLNVAGLALVLDGLAVRIALADPAAVPAFALRGLGLSYTSGDVSISAAFLADTIQYEGRTLPAYSGKAVLRTSGFTLGAIGSYAQLPQGPSLFVYAFLNYPLGGPPIFYVEGLAAGFGYNRRLIAPDVAAIPAFPLVAEAAGQRAAPLALADEMRALRDYLPPSPGDYFLALGVRFSSFRMIDSVVLLSVGFGHRFEVDVLGLSTMVLPSPDTATAGVTPLAVVQLALRASLVPDDGYLAVQAQLTSNSYLLAPACKLTGGFAFQAWFGPQHTGDFVVSFGGYHPALRPPAHYPVVPRLGFAWQVSPKLSMKGSAYFALTPSMLMAGGSFAATWDDGPAKAWFAASMNFLIGWKPLHYEADFQVSAGVEYTFELFGRHTLRATVSARANIWGPEFSARATISIGPFSVTVSHGELRNRGARPIDWPTFRESFLPGTDSVVTVVLQAGAVAPGSGTAGHLGLVNPLELVLRTDSAIPSSAASRGPDKTAQALDTGAATTAFRVAPLGRDPNPPVVSIQRIEITSISGRPADHLFHFEPLTKNLPAAMWGDRLQPSLSGPSLVEGLLTGYAVRPLPPHEPDHPAGLSAEALRATTPVGVRPDPFQWRALPPGHSSTDDPQTRSRRIADTIRTTDVGTARAAMTAAVFPGDEWVCDLSGFDVADLLAVAQVEVAR